MEYTSDSLSITLWRDGVRVPSGQSSGIVRKRRKGQTEGSPTNNNNTHARLTTYSFLAALKGFLPVVRFLRSTTARPRTTRLWMAHAMQ
jgi:hypothetical protein